MLKYDLWEVATRLWIKYYIGAIGKEPDLFGKLQSQDIIPERNKVSGWPSTTGSQNETGFLLKSSGHNEVNYSYFLYKFMSIPKLSIQKLWWEISGSRDIDFKIHNVDMEGNTG